jgi:hypothetical protein
MIIQLKPGNVVRIITGWSIMSTKTRAKKKLSEKDIDQLAIAQANDDAAWGKPVCVQRAKPAALSIPADLAARAAFFARLHRKTSAEEWLRHIIRERVELEEAAFAGAKHDLAAKTR